jgi:hypothetical protein
VIFWGVHLAFVQICGREEMGIASQEAIRQLQALMDQGLCFSPTSCSYFFHFSFKDHFFNFFFINDILF